MNRVALIQMCSGPDRQANLVEAGRLMGQAVEQGAALMVLPECFSLMAQTDEEKIAGQEDPDNSPSLIFLQQFAAKHGVWIVGGSITIAVPGSSRFANTCFVVDDGGEVQARYDKIHLFDAQIGERKPYRESKLVCPGDRPVVVDTPFGRIGLSVCYDLRFPELFRQLTAMGATLFTVPSAFTVSTGQAHWEVLLRARAIENFAYVLAAGQEGRHPNGRRTYGHSMVVEPWGTIISQCPEGVGVILADLEQNRVTQARKKIPCVDTLLADSGI
ncbi:MAG: carbon-nitrogen hydrolase family protein [Magnetococcales bacterium]|nr:carbon-nitrogen hydrolase family protein [Magnetococcales bacterium]